MTDLVKKTSLTRAISSMQQLFPSEYRFYPKSWYIPAQMDDFCKYVSESSAQSWYIVKPDDG